jgi:hypothetical protein
VYDLRNEPFRRYVRTPKSVFVLSLCRPTGHCADTHTHRWMHSILDGAHIFIYIFIYTHCTHIPYTGPSLLRRHGAAYAARVGMIARGLGGARRSSSSIHHLSQEELDIDEEELWESVVDNMELAAGEAAESAMESLAMEVSGMVASRTSSSSRWLLPPTRHAAQRLLGNSSSSSTNRRSLVEAAHNAVTLSNQQQQQRDAPNPVELMRVATEHAASYQPVWANPSLLLTRGRTINQIQVGKDERQNLAHLPSGSGEGRAIRTDNALPRPDASSALARPDASSALARPDVSSALARPDVSSALARPDASSALDVSSPLGLREVGRTFGFKVAFDHPSAETGGSMGGCHLVGVTTSSFTAFGEQNGLQQSPFFWGIEDGGQKYEGSQHVRGGGARRGAYNSFRNELGSREAPFNPANVLFGAREVVTVVCDYDTRTLTFWRGDVLLGTLISNLPRSGNLFPVAVPFNCGVTVVITGLDGDPLPL